MGDGGGAAGFVRLHAAFQNSQTHEGQFLETDAVFATHGKVGSNREFDARAVFADAFISENAAAHVLREAGHGELHLLYGFSHICLPCLLFGAAPRGARDMNGFVSLVGEN